ncbi:hypothetical protein B0I35DRAFT_430914 [Stachybotrys elegans]|uniref:Uncharacterized protein n=1 Tax=Stachybotrys elegans TaxID=80388 RepID=A0A8K0WS55_9HYPO|nr:hypothetical protein B0I35DRAFT_430914 [Stachybotrys elegans]
MSRERRVVCLGFWLVQGSGWGLGKPSQEGKMEGEEGLTGPPSTTALALASVQTGRSGRTKALGLPASRLWTPTFSLCTQSPSPGSRIPAPSFAVQPPRQTTMAPGSIALGYY